MKETLPAHDLRVPPPLWQAVDEKGQVVGAWKEYGYFTAEHIRNCRDQYHPGTRLQVLRYTVEVETEGDWEDRAVTLKDHFDDWTTMRVAEPQPQYGLVQLNVERKGLMISVDVRRADLLAALEACKG